MKAPTGAGDLRHRVRFDKKVEASDSGGGILSAWSSIGTGSFIRWADIRPQRGGEGVQAQRLTGTQPALIFVRSDTNTRTIDPSWRAVLMRDGVDITAYGLKTAQDMEMENQLITFMATAGEADA